MVVKELGLLSLVPSMLEQTCELPSWYANGTLKNYNYRILLDDCLAAVDSHVGRHIFGTLLGFPYSPFISIHVDHVIGPDGLLSTKARILVTNNISFIKQFDSLIYIRRGIILEHGAYHSLISNPNSETAKLVYGFFLFTRF